MADAVSFLRSLATNLTNPGHVPISFAGRAETIFLTPLEGIDKPFLIWRT
jgi:hypothetical protein